MKTGKSGVKLKNTFYIYWKIKYFSIHVKTVSMKLYVVTCFLLLSFSLSGQIEGFSKVRWEKEKLAPGLVWKSSHTMIDDSIPQNINLLIVNLNKRKISIVYNPKENIKTSKQAAAANAIAAVNAGFFSIRDGGSVNYIKIAGKIVDTDTAKKWPEGINFNGAFMSDAGGHVSIGQAMQNSWFDTHTEFPDVLVTGPLLLEDGKKTILPQTSLVITRHPRTSIGVVNKHKAVMVTIDGRTGDSRGMTLLQLSDIMLSLHCKDAVNLDGGGSTTMWITGKPFNGVVNMPCDNKKFDHEGERAVSDILIIK